ncbi:MAG: GntR family transcriptional regulator [Clostridia bacterium]|nr:GntR family transcriptional regulator [Clostridia bacterium]
MAETKADRAVAETVASQIYHVIRDKIIFLQQPPGSTMSEQETATMLGVSRTPVRESFIRLAREKMLIISPQRRTAVAKISLDRVRQEQFLRESIECAVLESFISHPTEAGLEGLTADLTCQRQALAAGDVLRFRRHDDSFHRKLYAATDNMFSWQVIRRTCFDYQRLRSLSAEDSAVQALNLQQHEVLLSLIRAEKSAEARALLVAHLRRLFEEIPAMREKYPQYFE